MIEFNDHDERLSDVDGFTIVDRDGKAYIHLLRAWDQCDIGEDSIGVQGSREVLLAKLGELGYSDTESCRICFPYNGDSEEVGEPEYDEDDQD